jgi:hypothetical protein
MLFSDILWYIQIDKMHSLVTQIPKKHIRLPSVNDKMKQHSIQGLLPKCHVILGDFFFAVITTAPYILMKNQAMCNKYRKGYTVF